MTYSICDIAIYIKLYIHTDIHIFHANMKALAGGRRWRRSGEHLVYVTIKLPCSVPFT